MENKRKNGWLLVVIQAVMCIAGVYFYTFVTAEFYSMFGEGTVAIYYVAKYFLIAYMFMMIAFVAVGNKCKKNAKMVLLGSIVLNGITLFLIVTGDIVNYYIVIAIIFGVSQGLYYSPITNLVSKLGEDSNIKKFWTTSELVNKIASFVFPITIGAYIEVASFKMMAIILLVIIMIQFIAACAIDCEKSVSAIVEKINLFGYLKRLRKEKNKDIYTYYLITACEGVTGSILDKLITILIILMYHSSFTLGALSTVFALLQIGIVFLIKKFYNFEKLRKITLVLSIATSIALVVFAMAINTQTFVVYKFISTMSLAILGLLNSIARYNSLGKQLADMSQEHQSVVEIVYGIVRIVGFAIIIAITATNANVIIVLRLALCLCAIVIAVYGIAIRKLIK